MEILQAVVLGVVEGVTEFLPISSTGHMVLVSHLMGIGTDEFVKTFEIVIQLGAIAAVGMEYGRELLHEKTLFKKIILTFIPTGLLGVLFYGLVKQYLLSSVAVTVMALMVGGMVMIGLERWVLKPEGKNRDKDELTIGKLSWGKCVILGCLQAVAIVPGVSRAAMTIMGGMGVGLSRSEATKFSFLVAAPTLLFASGYDLLKSNLVFTPERLMLLAIGFAIAFGSAWVVVTGLMRYLRNHTFELFGWYRIVLGLGYLWILGR